jgi:hypothetical protein
LFAGFLRDFIKIDLFKGVQANDIKDITERFLPLFQEGRDSEHHSEFSPQKDAAKTRLRAQRTPRR